MAAFDLVIYARGHVPGVRENTIWSIGWIAVALLFGVVFWAWQGAEAGSQYLAGYLLERSLSLDNIFVFAVILSLLRRARGEGAGAGAGLGHHARARPAPDLHPARRRAARRVPHHVLRLRRCCCSTRPGSSRATTSTDIEPEHNPALKFIRKRVTMTEDYDGDKLFTKVDGKRIATPLLAVFVVIATTDIIFAVDSIPAIFAVTQEPFIVFAANAFALIGLRSLYFLLVGLMDRFVYLSEGLAFILAFIGVKMLLIDIWHVPIWLSLAVIVADAGRHRAAVAASGDAEEGGV